MWKKGSGDGKGGGESRRGQVVEGRGEPVLPREQVTQLARRRSHYELWALNGPMITSILYTRKYFYLTRSWGMESQEEIGFRGPSADLSILPISQDIHEAIKVFIYNFSKRILLLWMTQYHKLPLILLHQRRYKEMKDEIQGITTRFRQLRVVERQEDLNSKEEALRLVIRRGRGPESWEDFCRSHSKQIAGLAQELSSPLSQFIV